MDTSAMNDINLLMSRIDEINHKPPAECTPSDIADLIKYHRHNRARKASGQKPERPAGPTIDLAALLNLPVSKPSAPLITRRI